MREKEENHFTPSFFLGQELGCVDRSRIEKERKGADRKVARKGSFFSSALFPPPSFPVAAVALCSNFSNPISYESSSIPPPSLIPLPPLLLTHSPLHM